MAGWTNRGKYKALDWLFRGTALPTNFYVALVTSAVTPAPDINTFSELTEIANGNGYTTGGYQLTKNSTYFDTLTEDDANDKALVKIKDVAWTASGGPIPASGNVPAYAVLLDDNGTVGNRLVLHYWSLGTVASTPNGVILTLADLEIDLTES
jgi:hypothetical protein